MRNTKLLNYAVTDLQATALDCGHNPTINFTIKKLTNLLHSSKILNTANSEFLLFIPKLVCSSPKFLENLNLISFLLLLTKSKFSDLKQQPIDWFTRFHISVICLTLANLKRTQVLSLKNNFGISSTISNTVGMLKKTIKL